MVMSTLKGLMMKGWLRAAAVVVVLTVAITGLFVYFKNFAILATGPATEEDKTLSAGLTAPLRCDFSAEYKRSFEITGSSQTATAPERFMQDKGMSLFGSRIMRGDQDFKLKMHWQIDGKDPSGAWIIKAAVTDFEMEVKIEGKSEKAAREYFSNLGLIVCTWLDEAGFDLCKGDVMAQNQKWCQPLSVWKKYFKSWIFTADPEDLLRASIFFDFHRAYGDKEMVRELRRFLFSSLKGWPGFFRHLAENALHVKPPLNLFRNIAVESKGPHRKEFDIKKATLPIVDIARIYALKHGIAETNTQERLRRLHQKKVLSLSDYLEIDKAYDLLMHLRFTHQVATVIQDRKKPDNYISPGKLSRIEVTMLKEAFKCIENFQAKLRFEFIGDV